MTAVGRCVRRTRRVAAAAAVVVGAACAAEPEEARPRVPFPPESREDSLHYYRGVALELATLDDSAAAARLRDSLARDGWAAYVRRRERGGRAVWVVRAEPSAGTRQTRPPLLAAALRERGWAVEIVSDTFLDVPLYAHGVAPPALLLAARAAGGTPVRTRWVTSADRRLMIVLQDPRGPRSEALPHQMITLADSEQTFPSARSVVRVWDVAPSPSWHRRVVVVAQQVRSAPGDTVRAASWDTLSHALGIPAEELRAAALRGRAGDTTFWTIPVVSYRTVLGPKRATSWRVAGAWRVAWSADGRELLVGRRPRGRAADEAAVEAWVAYDTLTGARVGERAGAEVAAVPWVEGPAIGPSTNFDVTRRVAIAVDSGSVEASGGWIRRNGRVLGPGLPLVATRNGRLVVAVVPRVDAKPGERRYTLGVYADDDGALERLRRSQSRQSARATGGQP